MPAEFEADGTCDLYAQLMVGAVSLSAVIERSGGVMCAVLPSVPAFRAKIHATSQGRDAVDEDQLFVVRSSQGMVAIEDEVHAGVELLPDPGLQPLALGDIKDRMVPEQQVEMQLRPGLAEAENSVPEALGR